VLSVFVSMIKVYPEQATGLPFSAPWMRKANVLPNTYNQRFQEIMSLKLVGLRNECRNEFLRAYAHATRTRAASPSVIAGLQNRVDVHLVEKSIVAAVKLQRELLSALQIPFSDSLAKELRAQVKAHVSRSWCKELHKRNIRGISSQHAARLKEELFVNRDFFLKRAEAQIDYLVDALRTKKQTSPAQRRPKKRGQAAA